MDKRAKQDQAFKTQVADFVSLYPDKEPYFAHVFKEDNKKQKKLQDELLFNQISAKLIEDALKRYNDKELERVEQYKDIIKYCKLATE